MNATVRELLVGVASAWGIELNQEMVGDFALYLRKLQMESAKYGLTSLREEEEIMVTHFLDSLSCLLTGEIRAESKIVDVGAGGGFPGIPIRISRPQVQLTLVESSKKKAGFLADLVSELMLDDVAVMNIRAEELGRETAHRESYDVALGRAVAPLPVMLEYALPFLKQQGAFIAQTGPGAREEIELVQEAAGLLGGEIETRRSVVLPGGSQRELLVIRKVSLTPERYPRRIGIPRKRPLPDLGKKTKAVVAVAPLNLGLR